jgi:ribosomal protein S18 acetylase RimI-like enzyme
VGASGMPASDISSYKLIAATPSDMEWLDVLRRDVYADLFQATWGAWDEARHRRHFSEWFDRGHIQIIEMAGERVGMIQVFNRSDALEVGEIQIQPKHQNRGIASRVLLDIVATARGNGKIVRLSVALKNESALRLYQRLGFRPVARSETHIHLESKL